MKKLLFVINTLGYGGAERAMLDLFEVIKNESYDISLFVLTGQGELICELPSHIHLLNQNYSDISVLTDEGRKQLMKSVTSGLQIIKKLVSQREHLLLTGLSRRFTRSVRRNEHGSFISSRRRIYKGDK